MRPVRAAQSISRKTRLMSISPEWITPEPYAPVHRRCYESVGEAVGFVRRTPEQVQDIP